MSILGMTILEIFKKLNPSDHNRDCLLRSYVTSLTRHHDTQYYDTQHNDAQNNDTQHNDSKHKKVTEHNGSVVVQSFVYAECHKLALMLNVVMLSVIMLKVVASLYQAMKLAIYDQSGNPLKVIHQAGLMILV